MTTNRNLKYNLLPDRNYCYHAYIKYFWPKIIIVRLSDDLINDFYNHHATATTYCQKVFNYFLNQGLTWLYVCAKP